MAGSDENFVDLTPNAIGGRQVRLTPEDVNIIENNPRGLTKEGCAAEIWYWYQSTNIHMQLRYLAMYQRCKNFTKSAVFDDGSILLAKKTFVTNNGVQKQHIWTEKIGYKNKFGEPIIMESVDKLHQFVQSKLMNLKFLTEKGV